MGKEFYSARAFYALKSKENQEEEWKKAMIEVLNKVEANKKDAKYYCKNQKGVITLFDDQNAKAFRMGDPQGGWGT